MTLKGLLILTTVLLFGSADVFAIRPATSSYRKPLATKGTARTLKNSGLKGSKADVTGRKSRVYPYSSKGHTLKAGRNKKSFRGGRRGAIRVLR